MLLEDGAETLHILVHDGVNDRNLSLAAEDPKDPPHANVTSQAAKMPRVHLTLINLQHAAEAEVWANFRSRVVGHCPSEHLLKVSILMDRVTDI